MKKLVVLPYFFTLFVTSFFCFNAAGQTPTPTPSRPFFKDIARDQKAIWTAPFKLKKDDAKKVIPFAALAAGLILTDRFSTSRVGPNGSLPPVSRVVSRFGNTWTMAGAAAGLYLIGKETKNPKAAKTGKLAMEALIDTALVTQALKLGTGRLRPDEGSGHGLFFRGGSSFPSGHASSSWAVATVVAYQYKNKPAIKIAAFVLAAAVSLSRYTGRRHFVSDVVIGGALGFGIGHYVYLHR